MRAAALALAAVVVACLSPSAVASAREAAAGSGPTGAETGEVRRRPGPARVVTLAPHLTELLYAAGAGDRLVGTVDTSDWPETARRVPRIGDVAQLDAERLLELRPDLVIAWGDGSPAAQLALVRRLGLPVLEMQQHSLADVPAAVEQLGRLFGTQQAATRAAAGIRESLAALRARYRGVRMLRVFYQVWDSPPYTLGGRHVVTEMLRLCGASNVFAEQRTSGFPVDRETVYVRDPDAVVLAGTRPQAAAWREAWVRGPRLRAVEADAFVQLDPDLVNRMGPRIVDGTAILCERLDRFRR